MAYGPCPKCQTREGFDQIFQTMPMHRAFETAGYLVMDGGRSSALRCTKDDSHVWDSPDAVAPDLKAAGYLSYY